MKVIYRLNVEYRIHIEALAIVKETEKRYQARELRRDSRGYYNGYLQHINKNAGNIYESLEDCKEAAKEQIKRRIEDHQKDITTLEGRILTKINDFKEPDPEKVTIAKEFKL